VICCQYARDAERILRALRQRLTKYRLRLHEEKTRLDLPRQRMRALVLDPTGALSMAVDAGEIWRVAPRVP
jgi:hypothetical protein